MKILNVYYKECIECPYFKQNNLSINKVYRQFPPIRIENNKSHTLLVFESPGINEWNSASPIQPIHVQGGSAGVRIKNSWDRCGKQRSDYDIVEAVRCYPGKGSNGRDNKPEEKAKTCCSKILIRELGNSNYSQIIVFGKPAKEVMAMVIRAMKVKKKLTVTFVPHPNSSDSNNSLLDSLW